MEPHQNIRRTVQISSHPISGFSNHEKGAFEARNFEVINGLQHVFEEWVERCKNASLAKGGTSKKRPSPHLHKVPTLSNKASPRTLQTVLVETIVMTEVEVLPRNMLEGKGEGKVVPVLLTEHQAMKAYWGSGFIAPRVIDLSTKSR
jgi:hypothetical protein